MNLEYGELEGGLRLIKLIGKLDTEGTAEVSDEFARLCRGQQVYMLVDLSRMTYLSSIGIPLLVSNAKTVVEHGGRLALVAPQPNVKYILEITGVTHVLRVYNDMETAQQRIRFA